MKNVRTEIPASAQIAILLGATAGLFDNVPPGQVAEASARIRDVLANQFPQLAESIEAGNQLSASDRETLVKLVGA